MRYGVQLGRVSGIALALMLVALAGCGGSDDDGGEEGSPATKPAELSGSLTVVSNWTGSEGEAFQAVIDGFKAKAPGVTVEINQVPFDQTQAQLAQQFAAGSPPDVSVALPGIVRQFSEQDLLVNLDGLWDEWLADGSYTEAVRDIAEGADGQAAAVMFKGNVNGLIWNTPKQLEKLGIDEPASWDDFLAAADKAQAEGVPPFAVGGADGWPLTQWSDPIILRVAGAEAFNQLARGEIGWDDPRIVESFEVYADLVEEYFPDNALSTGFVDATCARADGKYLFQNQGAFISLVAPGECDKSLKPGKDFTFFEMPKYDESAPDARAVSGDLFMGAKDSENPDATMALLEYLGSAEAQQIWADRGGYIAPNADVPLDAYPTEIDRRAAELWPRDPDTEAGYDLDDWIGGEIQSRYVDALEQFVRDPDAERFIATMVEVDTRSTEG
jgi:alpha-glucoside transport system substrate-binding protein